MEVKLADTEATTSPDTAAVQLITLKVTDNKAATEVDTTLAAMVVAMTPMAVATAVIREVMEADMAVDEAAAVEAEEEVAEVAAVDSAAVKPDRSRKCL